MDVGRYLMLTPRSNMILKGSMPNYPRVCGPYTFPASMEIVLLLISSLKMA